MLRDLLVVLLFLTLVCNFVHAVNEPQILDAIEVRSKKGYSKSTAVSENPNQTIFINDSKENSFNQVLQKTTAVWIPPSSSATNPSIFLRGQVGVQNRFFLEGIALTDGQFNSDHVGLVPFQSLGRIEIYPDGAPVGLNSEGLGGAIDLHLLEFSQSSFGLKSGSLGMVELQSKSSLDRGKTTMVITATRSNEDFNYYDDGGTPYNASDDSINRREHNRYSKLALVPKISLYQTDRINLNYIGANSFRTLQVPGSVSIPSYGNLKQIFHLSAFNFRTWLSSEVKLQTGVFTRLNWEQYQGRTTKAIRSSSPQNESFDKTFGFKNQIQWFSFSPVTLEQSLSVIYETYNFNEGSPKQLSLDSSRIDFPIAVGASVPFKKFWLKPAFMGQYSSYEGARKQNYLLGSPRLGLLWQGEGIGKGIEFEVGLGRYFRTPSMVELFGNGYGLVSSMQLLPETADRGLISFKLDRKINSDLVSELKFQLSYGLVKAHQLIVYVENSQVSKVATNLGSALVQSRDLDLGFKVLDELYLQTGVSWFIGENRSDVSYYQGKKIPSVPIVLVKQRAQYPWGPLDFNYQFQWLGERYIDLANLKKVNPTTEHSCFVSWDAKDLGTFNLELFNLLDTITATSVISGFTTFDNTTGLLGYPAPGRRIYLTWQYPI